MVQVRLNPKGFSVKRGRFRPHTNKSSSGSGGDGGSSNHLNLSLNSIQVTKQWYNIKYLQYKLPNTSTFVQIWKVLLLRNVLPAFFVI
jgi:hypothetical protein